MNNPSIAEDIAKRVVAIVSSAQDSILSGWQKMSNLNDNTDLLAIVEPGDTDTSILIMKRDSGLTALVDKGVDIEHKNLQMLREPATGATLESSAIWVVVLYDKRTHVTKLVHQPMSQAGSA